MWLELDVARGNLGNVFNAHDNFPGVVLYANETWPVKEEDLVVRWEVSGRGGGGGEVSGMCQECCSMW